MQSFHTETIIENNGELHLEHLPFPSGEKVHVYVSRTPKRNQTSLKDTIVKYELPFETVSESDWETTK
jgi:hypothetical protein